MSAWLTIKSVVHGEREREDGWQIESVPVTIVTYEVEGEPGFVFRAILDDHLPTDADLVCQVKEKYLYRRGGTRA